MIYFDTHFDSAWSVRFFIMYFFLIFNNQINVYITLELLWSESDDNISGTPYARVKAIDKQTNYYLMMDIK